MKINKLTDIDHSGTKSYKGRPKKVYLDNKACAFDGHLRVHSYHLKHEQYDGNLSGSIHREVMSRGDAVAVLLFDPYRQEIVLIEQFRVGAWAAGDLDPWLVECIAGLVEDGEEAREVAIRETLEESGCSVLKLAPITKYFTTPGCSSEQVELFCGQIDSAGVGGYHGINEEGEDISVSVWPLNSALRLIDEGKIRNSMTIIALQWLALHHVALTTDWTTASS